MVNWDDPQVQRIAIAAFGQLNVFVLGAYLCVLPCSALWVSVPR